MTTIEVKHQINRFRIWASQCENLASIPRVSGYTEIKGRALSDAYRHCADALERALEGRNNHQPHNQQ
jgi:hypothetical protein